MIKLLNEKKTKEKKYTIKHIGKYIKGMQVELLSIYKCCFLFGFNRNQVEYILISGGCIIIEELPNVAFLVSRDVTLIYKKNNA